MATKCSIAPAVVWNWVIEALASSEQADMSTLIGLVKVAPAISGDAGKGTKEIVSLRILESLFDHGDKATVDVKTHKVSFDPSERCEDILKNILRETPKQMTKLEKDKWNVGPFLKHKRSSLSTCVLKKLKEAILDNSNPLLASLKEKSKIVISNASEDASPTNGELHLNSRKGKRKFQETALQDDNVPKDTHTMGHSKRVSVDSMENLEFADKSKGSNIVQPNNERVNYDDDERTDIAAKKEAYLKSHCAINQDSVTLTEWSKIDRCMKCKESGELLLCSSDSCQLRFHESCLGSTVTLDENRDFFCPFCACLHVTSKYQEAIRNASLARKNLQAFSKFTVKSRPNKSSTKQSELEENEDRQMGDKNIKCGLNDKACAQPDPMIKHVHDDDDTSLEQTTPKQKCKEKDSQRTQRSTKSSLTRKRKAKHSPPPEPTNLNQKCKEKDSQKSTESSLTRKRKAKHSPPPEPTNLKQKFKEKDSQRSTESSLTIKVHKRKAEHSPPPPVTLLRRKNVPWTKAEEETLKEGVRRYSSGNWKAILDFGHKVFQEGRTSVDLKDKWRNMCKSNPYV